MNDPEVEEFESLIRDYAKECGYNLVDVIRDEGVSGVAAWKPGLEKVMRGVERKQYVGVIILSSRHLAIGAAAAKKIAEKIEDAGAWIAYIRPDETHGMSGHN